MIPAGRSTSRRCIGGAIASWRRSWGPALIPRAPTPALPYVEQQLEQLSPEEQGLLETASVAGLAWSVAVVAAGLEDAVEAVEPRCARLARQGQLLVADGEEDWPGGLAVLPRLPDTPERT